MANNYPNSLNSHKKDWANNTPVEDTHPEEHNDIAGAVEELEKKVGASGSAVETSHDYKLGEVTGSDKAASKAAVDAHIADTENPHSVTKTQVGLGNVDNTSDATKNAATATLTNKTVNADNNTLSELEVDNFKADVIDTDSSMSANSDARIPTQKAVKALVEANAGGDGNVQEFTSDGTWTKPSGIAWVFIEAWGAGGSGGKSVGTGYEAAGGGAGGEHVAMFIPAYMLGATETVTVHTGGAARTGTGRQAGEAGGDTIFGSWLTANGGAGGTVSDGSDTTGASTAGTGGTSSFNELNKDDGGNGGGVSSGTAADGSTSTHGGAGGGGSVWNTIGAGGNSTYAGDGGAGVINSGAGGAGQLPGGGGGAASDSNGSARSSGAGGGGLLRITGF